MLATEEIVIPPRMHFIWAGGTKKLPTDPGMKNIVKWQLTNPALKPILWVDPKTSGKELSELIEIYKRDFKNAYIEEYKLLNKEISPDELEIPEIDIKSIREDNICANENDIVDYALDRVDPNYGMSSDILRYRILYKYGGGYVDVTDVTSAGRINPEVFKYGNIKPPCHALFLDHLSQKLKPKEEELASFELDQIDSKEMPPDVLDEMLRRKAVGNDTFFCTVGNPLMKHLAECAEMNFLLTKRNDSVGALMMAYTAYNIKNLTIEKTGPTLVTRENLDLTSGKIIEHPKLPLTYLKAFKGNEILIKPVRCKNYVITQPTKNTRMWNNIEFDATSVPNIDTACQKILKIIRFEASEISILRLDDHLRMISKIAKQLKQDPQASQILFLKSLEEAIPPIPFDKIMFPQSVSCNRLTDDFYMRKGMHDRIYLLKQPLLEEKTKLDGQINRFFTIFSSLTSLEYFNTNMFTDRILALTNTNIIEQYNKPLEIAGIFDMVDRGLEFIDKIFSDLNKYPIYALLQKTNENFVDYKKLLIDRYAKILNIYQEAFLRNGVSHHDLLEANKRIFKICGVSELITKLNLIADTYGAKDDYEKALRNAVANQRIEDVRFLCDWVNVNAVGALTGQSALHQAVQKGNVEIIKILLSKGADPLLKDKKDQAPIDLATHEIKELLQPQHQKNVL